MRITTTHLPKTLVIISIQIQFEHQKLLKKKKIVLIAKFQLRHFIKK